MSLYDFDTVTVAEQLTPPVLRQPKTMAWLTVLTTPLQWIRDRFFDDYIIGSSAADYSGATNYVRGDRVRWTDNGIYQALLPTIGIDPTGAEPYSSQFWFLVQKNYAGVTSRLQYNGQLIILQRAINQHFRVTVPDYIWIENFNIVGLGFTVHVPIALYNSLGSSNPNRTMVVRQFVDQYAVAGPVYTVATY